jgi:alanyl-tRNA synthetase
MKSNEIRQTFLNYFVQREHELVPGSSLVPVNDPTLLFVNAGMVPFKNTFLGIGQRLYKRACSVQKCMRVSGKRNDLENVGPSPIHHTFFEMLGNFSFGDYFKHDAIHYAWELLTRKFQLPIERLWITVYENDYETVQLWQEMGVARERILFNTENFWSMGDTGPCGYNTEVHYYRGRDVRSQELGSINVDDDSYVEVWNLVFMQYDRDEQGKLTPLPQLSIDTGMGLERLALALQDVSSDYETDLFTPILQRIMDLLGRGRKNYHEHYASYNVIADHSRAIAFLIADGVRPGNNGYNYVLRRILRRAAYVGRMLGFEGPFLSDIVAVVVDSMQEPYPELGQMRAQILGLTLDEEERFYHTLKKGLHYIENVASEIKLQGNTILAGSDAFKLYDTYGFPLDLTQKILSEQHLQVDITGYDDEMRKQQERSRNSERLRQKKV